MKLKHLSVRNFIGIVEAHLPITKPVNLFIGENGQGKTSLSSAPEYLATGTARGLTLKKDRSRLIQRGAGKAEVVATLENDITLRRTTAATSETFRAVVNNREVGEFPFNWNVIGFNPYLYFEKSIEERKNMLFRLVASESSTDQVKAKLVERGVPEDLATKVAAGVAEDGFQETQAAVIENRKALKRERDALKEITAPATVKVIDDVDYNLEEYTVEQLTTALQTVDTEKSRLLVEKGKISSAVPKAKVKADLDQVITDLTKAENEVHKDPEPIKQKLTELQTAVAKFNTDIAALQATKKLMAENRNLTVPDLDFEKCPVMEGINCPVSAKDRRKVKANFEDLKKRAEKVTKEADEEISGLIRDRDEKQREYDREDENRIALEKAIETHRRTLNALRTKKAELDKALESAVDTIGDTAKLDEEIQNLTFKATVGSTLIRAVEDYHKQKEAFDKAGPAIVARDEAIKVRDLLDKALSPNGIPSEMTQDALGEFKERIAKTSKFFNVSVEVNQEDYLPLWNGQHYNLLCESEKWRARLFFQEGIAHLAKTPWLIIDEASILDFQNRGYFFDVILEIAKDYDFVAIFATQNDETIPVIDHDLIDFWHVHEGQVTLLKPADKAQAA